MIDSSKLSILSRPHVFVENDNLNRPIKAALFETIDPDEITNVATPLSDRGAYIEIYYSQRGLVYERRLKVSPRVSHEDNADYLSTFTWFNRAGRSIEVWGPNAPAVKTVYDGLGRVKATYVTDRRSTSGTYRDIAPGSSGNYAAAVSVADDTVLEQTNYRYIKYNGLNDLVTHRMRTHNATHYGDLAGFTGGAASDVITTYEGIHYDGADRVIRTVSYGTNQSTFASGGSAPSPSSLPAWETTGEELVTEFTYNNRGLVETIKSNIGTASSAIAQVNKILYDDMSRTLATIENYRTDNGDVGLASTPWNSSTYMWEFTGLSSSLPDWNRVTAIVYLITDSGVCIRCPSDQADRLHLEHCWPGYAIRPRRHQTHQPDH